MVMAWVTARIPERRPRRSRRGEQARSERSGVGAGWASRGPPGAAKTARTSDWLHGYSPIATIPEPGLFPDHRPEEAHHDEEADEQGDQPDPAVGRVRAFVGHQLEADSESHGPGEEQEPEHELR